jgi:demethylmenaquinone methyltransferase/2-methoxy-6-polyprenyl-1,4-benzoquinol methylase
MNSDTAEYLRKLQVTVPLREPTLRAAIEAVALPAGSRGLDIGCGIGTQTLLLADHLGENGHVTGLDLSSDFLNHARVLGQESGLSGRVEFRQGNADRLPFAECSFDWAWSVDCVGYGTSNTVALLRETTRVVRPGGVVAIMAWSSERLLPGHPMLEARLSATASGLAPFHSSMSEELHLSRGLGWFRNVGLEEPNARALAGSVHAPLTADIRSAMSALIGMRWPSVESELQHDDRLEYQRLCDPTSADFILDHPDYYAFFTYSLFWGRVAE